MKANELRELSKYEIEQKYGDLIKEYFEMRKVKSMGKLDNPLQIRTIRREIARVKTVLKQKE